MVEGEVVTSIEGNQRWSGGALKVAKPLIPSVENGISRTGVVEWE
jgi:hypothetical protein